MKIVSLIFLVAVAVYGCKTAQTGESFVLSNDTATLPTTSTGSLDLAKDKVFAEMVRVRATREAQIDDSVVAACLGNAGVVTNWSDIVFHFYCQYGSLRACFTDQARASSKDYAGYQAAYDYCAANSAEFKSRIADLPESAKVFKHVMFSVYSGGGIDTFDQADQDEVINRFYGVTDPTDTVDCSKRPELPRLPSHPKYRGSDHCGPAVAGGTSGGTGGGTSGGTSGGTGGGTSGGTGGGTSGGTGPGGITYSNDVCTRSTRQITYAIKGSASDDVKCAVISKDSLKNNWTSNWFERPATFNSRDQIWDCSLIGSDSDVMRLNVGGTVHYADADSVKSNVCQ